MMQRQRTGFIKSILLPILCGIFPVLFLYSRNANLVQASSLVLPLSLMLALALLLFGLFFAFQRALVSAGLSAFFFLVLFHLYGTIYNRLADNSLVQIEHFTLIPTFLLIAFYGGFFISKLPRPAANQIQNLLLLVTGALVVYNIAAAVPSEIKKAQSRASSKVTVKAAQAAADNNPDVYFLVFDEYAGFDAIRNYWHDNYIDGFQSFLEQKGFFVAEHSHSLTTDTIFEIASRLNLKEYQSKNKSGYDLFDTIKDNKVMQIFKSFGYTTVVFDGVLFHHKTKPPITADYNMVFDASYVPGGKGFAVDEFSTLFLDQTMLRVFSNLYSARDLATDPNRKMIFYSLAKVVDLDEIPTPKFVYLHVMLPHEPMMFDENGEPLDFKHRVDWTYYLGQHKYATKRAEQLVDQLLKEADPKRPPIIILQSDHGARNRAYDHPDSVVLQNYDESYKTSILNAVYLPGYDYSQLADDLDPIEPFAIVLNHYFNAGVTIERLPPE